MLLYITNGEGETENDTFLHKNVGCKIHAMGRLTWAGIFSLLIIAYILFFIIGLQGGISPQVLWGQVQGVGLIRWVKIRLMVYNSLSARSTNAREALALHST